MNLDIYQLTKLVSKQKVIALGLFKDNKVDTETKYRFLFENIHNQKITNDNEAKKALNYSKNSKTFSKFKERYTKKIIDYILLSDSLLFTNEYVFEEHYRLLKLFTVAKLIHYSHQKHNSIKIYHHIFNQSKKQEHFDLLLFSGTELRQHYAFIEPDKKKYNYFDTELDKAQYAITRNLDLKKFYDRLSHENISTKEEDKEAYKRSILKKCLALLEGISEEDSYSYKSQVHEIMAFAYSINNQIEKSISISKSAVSLISQNKYAPKNKLYNANKAIMSSYLKLEDYSNAKIYLKNTLAMHTSQNFNYYRLKSLEYTIYANAKEYVPLFKATAEVVASKNLSKYESLQQEWKLREAYANILLESGFIKRTQLDQLNYKEFKLNKFLNEVDKYTKDKRGTNISILVVELIHFLIRKQYDKLTDRLDALNQYTYRYLRNDHTLRSNCFIKMLLKLPEAEYHPLRTIRYVKRYEKKLKENPFEVSLKQVDTEIIPYENLWEIILEILDLNLTKKKS